jgi:hypothetical protein
VNADRESQVQSPLPSSNGLYAPYLTLCQSSGYGKTRLAMEMVAHYFVIYVCLREQTSSGIPPRSSVLADAFCGATDHFSLLAQCSRRLLRFIKNHGNSNSNNARTAFLTESLEDGFWCGISEELDFTPDEVILFNEIFAVTPILFVFDEARVLTELLVNPIAGTTAAATAAAPTATISQFTLLRRALSFSFKICPVVGLFLDTNSKIWNFAPTKVNDSSARITDIGLALYPPFISMPTRGTLSTSKVLEERVCLGTSSLIVNRFSLVHRSRPMFPVFADGSKETANAFPWDDVVKFAIFKLNATPTAAAAAAATAASVHRVLCLMAVKFCVMPLDTSLCSSLVASHLATLREYSEDRSLLKVGYEAEPMLGEAASHLLRDDDVFTSHVETLADLVATGNVGVLFSKGNAGEFVASVLLSRAYDKAAIQIDSELVTDVAASSATKARSGSSKSSHAGVAVAVAGGGRVCSSTDPATPRPKW